MGKSSLKPFNMISFAIWVVGSSVMLPLCLYVSLIPVKFAGYGAYEDKIAGWLFVPLTVIAIFGFQWLVLRRHIPKASQWVWGNVAALLLGGLLIAIVSRFITATNVPEWSLLATPAVSYGVFLGLVQWFILRNYFANVFFWITLNCSALLLVLVIIGRSISNNIDMSLAGGVPAIFTGLALLWILRARKASAHTQNHSECISLR